MAVVLSIMIVSFGVWGIADIFRGFGQSSLATIGRSEISTEQFRQIYTDRLQQIGRQFGRPLTSEQARAYGLDRQVLQQTIAEATLDDQARRLRLGQSDDETRRMIFSDPNFKGVNGSFDPQRFQGTIRQYGFTEQRYIADQRRVSLRRQIAGTISAGETPPKVLVEALTRFQNEQRGIEYMKLGAAQAGTIDPPSPETLAAYFDDHKSQFRAPEYRKISFVSISPQDIAKWSDVSDDDARKLFEQRRDQLGTPEKREISQIVFPNADEAAAARGRIAQGMSFEDLAKERGLSAADISLGTISKSAVIDPAVADAAFALPSGEVSQPAVGKFGVALIKVGKIEPGVTPNYESFAPEIKKSISADRARASVADLHNKMEDERGGGASVIEAAQKLKLNAVTIEAVDRSGRRPDGQMAAEIPSGLDLVSQAFNSDVGVDNDPLSYGGGYVWYDVLGITPSHERTLDEVKDNVEARWREEQIANRLRGKATDIVQKLNQGAKLADEATAAGATVQTASGFKRDASVSGLPPSVVSSAFGLAKDTAGQTSGNGEWIVLRVTDIGVPSVDAGSEEVKKLRDTLQKGLTDEQVAQYVTKLEADIGVKINEAAFAQATGASNGNSNDN